MFTSGSGSTGRRATQRRPGMDKNGSPYKLRPVIMISIRSMLALLSALVLVGCAHPIDVAPDLSRLNASSPNRIAAKVGLHIPPDLSSLEVTTPGGGGDNVRYAPYAAIAPGFQRMLSNVFETVVPVASVAPAEAGAALDYVMVPTVVTNSGGSNLFTWPPETFTVDIMSTIRDKNGRVVATPRVVGTATATTGERISDHGFSGRRAFEDALRKMEVAIREWGTSPQPAKSSTARGSTVEERLKELKDLFERKLITEQEYEAKRKAILTDL